MLGLTKCNKIRHIVRLRQMLKRWRIKAHITAYHSTTSTHTSSSASAPAPAPSDVPAGYVAVYVGISSRRFVVRTTHLNHPMFKNLLLQAEEEYGFSNDGPLAIPCDESCFEDVLRAVSRSESSRSWRFTSVEDLHRCCHVDVRKNDFEFFGESRPLLHGLADKSACQIKVGDI